ncbi:MAG: hypothetical protein WKG07_00335 [Hymenobacter sp.]
MLAAPAGRTSAARAAGLLCPTLSTTKPAAGGKAAASQKAIPTPTKVRPWPRPCCDGFGALPHPGGTTFRVWALAASAVSVMGTFNDWHTSSHPLQAEADGNWAADLPGVKARRRLQIRAANADRRAHPQRPLRPRRHQLGGPLAGARCARF